MSGILNILKPRETLTMKTSYIREWSLSMTRVGAEDVWMGVETK